MEGFDKKMTPEIIAEQWAACSDWEKENLINGHWVPERPRKNSKAQGGMICFACGGVFVQDEDVQPAERPMSETHSERMWGAKLALGWAHIVCPADPVLRSVEGHPDTRFPR